MPIKNNLKQNLPILLLEFDFSEKEFNQERITTENNLSNYEKKLFLIGCYRSDIKRQLNWILTREQHKPDRLYNVRLSRDRDGFVDIQNPSVLSPSFLVLYEFGKEEENRYRVFKILGHKTYTAVEMQYMKYPDPTGNYLVYTLGEEIKLEGINVSALIQSRKVNWPNWKEGSPIYALGRELQNLSSEIPIDVPQKQDKKTSINKNCRFENCDYKDLINELAIEHTLLDLVLTDPPYCVSRDYQLGFSNMGRSGMNYGKWDYNFNQKEWINLCAPLVREGGAMIIFNDWKNLSYIVEALQENGFVIKDLIRWEKTNPMPRNVNSRYVMDFEVAVWAVKGNKKWTFNRPQQQAYLRPVYKTSTLKGHRIHPTQKSLEVFEELIRVHSNPGEIVFDPFAGSATTAVACLNENRKFIGCEIEYEYYQKATNRLCL